MMKVDTKMREVHTPITKLKKKTKMQVVTKVKLGQISLHLYQ